MARASRSARCVGEQAGAALPVPRLPGLQQALGCARRPRVGARARLLPRASRRVQRHPERPATAARGDRVEAAMTSLHVLMTADAVGGVWTYTLELARALAAYGVRTTIATMGPRPDRSQLAAAKTIPTVDVISSDFALEWMEG